MNMSHYEQMKQNGRTAEDACRTALKAGESRLAVMKVLHDVFGLDAMATKEVMLKAEETATSIDEHEGRIAKELGELDDDDSSS